MMENQISAVIVDTSAYVKAQCDFAGINNSIIPVFLRSLRSNNLPLLSHPILDYEIKKHIKDSALVKRATDLETQIKRCKEQLSLVGVDDAELLDRVSQMKIEDRLLESFFAFYVNSVSLPYVDAKDVFSDYFQAKPPFVETGKKKSEFPDAFVIKSVQQYCHQNPSSIVLVISDDSDWKKALDGIPQIVIVDSFSVAMLHLWNQLEDKSELIRMQIGNNIKCIEDAIAAAVSQEAFCIESIDTADEIEITDIRACISTESFIPLEVTESSALIQISASLSVDGSADYLDENRSVWDKEDQCYYYVAYAHIDFCGALADVECEVLIDFPADGSMNPCKVINARAVNQWDIELDLSEAEATVKDITANPEADYLADQADALEEYYRH